MSIDSSVKEWVERSSSFAPTNLKTIEGPLGELDAHLTLRTFIVGYSLTDADIEVWQTLRGNHVAHSFIKRGLMVNLSRWFKYIEEAYADKVKVPEKSAKTAKAEEKGDEGANYDIGLQNPENGVITRFPPEPR
jgi:glutamyl-tRNA synthetase